MSPLERIIDILADAHEELAAANAAAGYGDGPIASHRIDLALVDAPDLAAQSIDQMFDDMRQELARIAVALGRSSDGTGLDCDWHDLAGDVETLAIEAPFKLPRSSPHGR